MEDLSCVLFLIFFIDSTSGAFYMLFEPEGVYFSFMFPHHLPETSIFLNRYRMGSLVTL